MRMRVFVSGQSHGAARPEAVDGWYAFYAALGERDVVVTESISDADALVALNFQKRLLSEARDAGIPRSRRVLVAWEPPSLRPQNFGGAAQREFGLRLGFSPTWPQQVGTPWFRWPQGQDWSKAAVLSWDSWLRRDPRAVIICGNHISASRGSLYPLRRRVLASEIHGQIALRGRGWPSTPARDLKLTLRESARQVLSGRVPNAPTLVEQLKSRPRLAAWPVHDKYEELRRFRMALVIENSLDYVSEKLFDAIVSGCLPIYVGADLGRVGLNSSLALQVEPRLEAIAHGIQSADQDVVERVAAAHRDFLHSHVEDWKAETTLGRLAHHIAGHLQGNY